MLKPEAANRGFRPDCTVCASDVPQGRPAPWMIFENARRLGCYPLHRMVEIGDTAADMEEGLNAGMRTIGVTRSGNGVGLSREEVERMAGTDELDRLMDRSVETLSQAGAHYVVPGIWACLPILEEIAQLIQSGANPLTRD